eukprot:6832246-Pyramimonas_sp.AAC.1
MGRRTVYPTCKEEGAEVTTVGRRGRLRADQRREGLARAQWRAQWRAAKRLPPSAPSSGKLLPE